MFTRYLTAKRRLREFSSICFLAEQITIQEILFQLRILRKKIMKVTSTFLNLTLLFQAQAKGNFLLLILNPKLRQSSQGSLKWRRMINFKETHILISSLLKLVHSSAFTRYTEKKEEEKIPHTLGNSDGIECKAIYD
jgi:hypothetical protein